MDAGMKAARRVVLREEVPRAQSMAVHPLTVQVAMAVNVKPASVDRTTIAVPLSGTVSASIFVRQIVDLAAAQVNQVVETAPLMGVHQPMDQAAMDAPVKPVYADRTITAVTLPGTTFVLEFAPMTVVVAVEAVAAEVLATAA